MNNELFNNIVNDQLETCKHVLGLKGDEYDSATKDRLHSFKVAAEVQNVSPMQALAGMMAKHTVSIYDMCHDGEYPESRWNEKITDSINYLLLLKALYYEEVTINETNSD